MDELVIKWFSISVAVIGFVLAEGVWRTMLYLAIKDIMRQQQAFNQVLLNHTHNEDGGISYPPEVLEMFSKVELPSIGT